MRGASVRSRLWRLARYFKEDLADWLRERLAAPPGARAAAFLATGTVSFEVDEMEVAERGGEEGEMAAGGDALGGERNETESVAVAGGEAFGSGTTESIAVAGGDALGGERTETTESIAEGRDDGSGGNVDS